MIKTIHAIFVIRSCQNIAVSKLQILQVIKVMVKVTSTAGSLSRSEVFHGHCQGQKCFRVTIKVRSVSGSLSRSQVLQGWLLSMLQVLGCHYKGHIFPRTSRSQLKVMSAANKISQIIPIHHNAVGQLVTGYREDMSLIPAVF